MYSWLYDCYMVTMYFSWWWNHKFWYLCWIWHWRSRSITPANNKGLMQGILHKLCDTSLNKWRFIARTNLVTFGHTHRQTQATTIPGGQNWLRVKSYDRQTYIETDTQTDRQTDRQTNRRSRLWSCLPQLKTMAYEHVKLVAFSTIMPFINNSP